MALWNRTSSKPEPKPQLEPWEYAKQVTEAEWKSGELPLGWYCFTPNNVVWIGLKPDDDCTRLISSPAMQRPQDLDEWLGIPTELTLHPERIPKKESFEELMRQIRGNSGRTAITPVQEPEPEQRSDKEETPKQRKADNKKYLKQMHFWVRENEVSRIKSRVARSGLSQSEFLRRAALTGRIQIEERSLSNMAILDELELLRAEIGRQGGLLKMVIKPNEGQRELAPDEWKELVQTIRDIEQLTKKLGKLGERL